MVREKVLDRNSLWDAAERQDQDEALYINGMYYDAFIYRSTGIRIVLN